MHAIPKQLSLKVQKDCIKIKIKVGGGKNTCKLQHGTCNFWGVIAFTRSFDLGLYWKIKKVTQRSTSNVAGILIRRTSLLLKLQHDEGKSEALSYLQGAARCCHLNMTYLKWSKSQTKSTSNLSEILMWRISM